MNTLRLVIFLMFTTSFYTGCRDSDKSIKQIDKEVVTKFDKTLWLKQEGVNYPYREDMLNDVVYNDTIRQLTKDQVIELLGPPNSINENHLYYIIHQNRLGFMVLNQKTMVIKCTEEDTIEWIKIKG